MNVFMFRTDNCHNITTVAITSNHLQQQKIHVENDTAMQRHRGDGNIERCLATAKVVWQIILLQQHHNCGNNISFLATNKSVWRIILLPCHNNHGNNVYSLAINKIVRQMVYLP
jgi:hypothetical protein